MKTVQCISLSLFVKIVMSAYDIDGMNVYVSMILTILDFSSICL